MANVVAYAETPDARRESPKLTAAAAGTNTRGTYMTCVGYVDALIGG